LIDDLNTIAIDAGISIGTFTSCLTDGSQDEEVNQDVVDASVAGATDTPTFIMGISTDDNSIKEERLGGAQTYPAFHPVIPYYFRIEIKGFASSIDGSFCGQ
jgi:predicted DsbA family dithiol-disulfide isomerase